MSNVIFSKSSYDRLAEFQTMTVIFSDNGALNVKKQALSNKAKPHICSFAEKYDALNRYYAGKLNVIPCSMSGDDTVIFPFIHGKTMTSILTELFDKNKEQDAIRLIADFFEQVNKLSTDNIQFKSEEFIKVFGDYGLPDSLPSMNPANIDMNFDNIFVSDTGTYNVIDYEWTFSFPVPSAFVLFRVLFHSGEISQLHDDVRKQIYALLDADWQTLDAFYNMELNFQRYVYGKGRTMDEIYRKYGKPAYYTGQPAEFAVNNDYRAAYETETEKRIELQNRANELYEAYNTESSARQAIQKQAEHYLKAYNTERVAREAVQKQAEEYMNAYNTESKAREAAQKQAEEYMNAYNTESKAREAAQKQADEYMTAYNIESKAREAAQEQAKEYYTAYREEATLRENIEMQRKRKH